MTSELWTSTSKAAYRARVENVLDDPPTPDQRLALAEIVSRTRPLEQLFDWHARPELAWDQFKRLADWLRDDFLEGRSEHFSWDVIAAATTRSFSGGYRPLRAENHYLPSARPCPSCNRAPAQLKWFYYCTSEETWSMLHGRAGWLTICEPCHVQVDFFCELMS